MARIGSAWKIGAYALLVHAVLAGGCFEDGSATGDAGDDESPIPIESFAAGGWTVETVDATPGSGAYCSLAFNAAGHPWVSYQGPPSSSVLRLAQWNGTAWSFQTVASGTKGASSLAIDASGNPLLAFIRTGSGSVKGLSFARWTGSTWSIQRIDSQASSGEYVSMALDSLGQPVIAYRGDGNPGKLKLARRIGSAWNAEVVDGSADCRYLSLDLDASDRPAIAYSHSTGGASYNVLRFARRSGTTWSLVTLDSGSGVGLKPSLKHDPATGHPCVAHGNSVFSPATAGKKFARWDGAAWSTEAILMIDSTSGTNDGSLDFDASGAPVVAFKYMTHSGPTEVRYGRRTDEGWQIENVDTTSTLSGSSLSTPLRIHGTAVIAYRWNDVLKLARRDAP